MSNPNVSVANFQGSSGGAYANVLELPSSGGIAGITTQDEGVTVGTAAGVSTVNFVGSGVSVSGAGSTATVTVAGFTPSSVTMWRFGNFTVPTQSIGSFVPLTNYDGMTVDGADLSANMETGEILPLAAGVYDVLVNLNWFPADATTGFASHTVMGYGDPADGSIAAFGGGRTKITEDNLALSFRQSSNYRARLSGPVFYPIFVLLSQNSGVDMAIFNGLGVLGTTAISLSVTRVA